MSRTLSFSYHLTSFRFAESTNLWLERTLPKWLRIAQRLRQISGEVFQIEEGTPFPALQKPLAKG
jgi:hypothetical protein